VSSDRQAAPPAFGQVTYQNVYSGIDVVWHGSSLGRVEYDFSVSPNSDTSAIRLDFQGASGLELDSQGNLIIHTPAGDVTQTAPQLWQDMGGVHQSVAGSFVLLGGNQAGFQVGAYDHSKTLTIDPQQNLPATVTYDFSSPTGALGTSQTYTAGGVTITAYGFTTGGTATNLFGKAGGGDENGVGISNGGNNEIDSTHVVSIDANAIYANFGHTPAQMQLKVGSSQSGETYDVYGSNSAFTGGSLGTLIVSASNLDNTYFNINPGSFRYINVTAHNSTNDDVLVSALQVTPSGVPQTYTDECT
jgi:hypothetical protein